MSRKSAVIGAFRSSHCFIVRACSSSLSLPSAVRCCTVFQLWFLIVDIHASGISISLSLLMLLGVNSFLDLMCVPVRMVAGLVGVFRNGGGLGKSESYIPVMFFDLLLQALLHRFSCFPDVDFAALAGNPIDYAILFGWVDCFFWSH